ncbi:MAG: TIGR01459 family HAD-type hydrolase, partial [Alphaproteobacteria bacterium]
MDGVKICEGISDISDSYSGILIDQWGTLHDGEKPYDGVIEALENLKSRGKQIILISNSGQRAEDNTKRLVKIGFRADLFNHVVTSAEVTWRSLENREEGVFKGLGNKCFLMNRANDVSVLNDTDIVVVDDVNDADFVLLTGSEAPTKTLENYYDDILRNAKEYYV